MKAIKKRSRSTYFLLLFFIAFIILLHIYHYPYLLSFHLILLFQGGRVQHADAFYILLFHCRQLRLLVAGDRAAAQDVLEAAVASVLLQGSGIGRRQLAE